MDEHKKGIRWYLADLFWTLACILDDIGNKIHPDLSNKFLPRGR